MNCPICFSRKKIVFHNKIWSLKEGMVFRCLNCDIIYLSYSINEIKRKKFYENYHEHVKKRGVTVTTYAIDIHKYSKKSAEKRYESVKKYIATKGSLLEIGASTGAFLELLKKKKPKLELNSVEPNPESRIFSEKFINKAYGEISHIEKDKKFNMIIMFHVLEHIRDPFSFLKQCSNHLVKNGLILIELPIIDDPLISLYDCRPFKDFYFQPMHPFVYSLRSLRYVFSKTKFQEQKIIYLQRYGLDNHLTWIMNGVPGGDGYLMKIFSKIRYKDALQDIRKTDTLIYIAKNIP